MAPPGPLSGGCDMANKGKRICARPGGGRITDGKLGATHHMEIDGERYLHGSADMVNRACTRWLRERGLLTGNENWTRL